jgi:hypothetical protein
MVLKLESENIKLFQRSRCVLLAVSKHRHEKKQANEKSTLAFVEGEKTAAEPTHYVTRLSQAPLLPEDPSVGKNQTHRVPTQAHTPPSPYAREGR